MCIKSINIVAASQLSDQYNQGDQVKDHKENQFIIKTQCKKNQSVCKSQK